MLRFEGQRLSLPRIQLVACPCSLEQVEPKVAPNRLLDDLAVPAPGPRRTRLDGPKDVAVDRERGSHLGHLGIIASGCAQGAFTGRAYDRSPMDRDPNRTFRNQVIRAVHVELRGFAALATFVTVGGGILFMSSGWLGKSSPALWIFISFMAGGTAAGALATWLMMRQR